MYMCIRSTVWCCSLLFFPLFSRTEAQAEGLDTIYSDSILPKMGKSRNLTICGSLIFPYSEQLMSVLSITRQIRLRKGV